MSIEKLTKTERSHLHKTILTSKLMSTILGKLVNMWTYQSQWLKMHDILNINTSLYKNSIRKNDLEGIKHNLLYKISCNSLIAPWYSPYKATLQMNIR